MGSLWLGSCHYFGMSLYLIEKKFDLWNIREGWGLKTLRADVLFICLLHVYLLQKDWYELVGEQGEGKRTLCVVFFIISEEFKKRKHKGEIRG